MAASLAETGATAAAPPAPARSRADIVAAARRWLGTPYRHQASAKGAGCDCLGLVRGIYREVIGPDPAPIVPYTPDWADRDGGAALLAGARAYLCERDDGEAEPGDVLLFRMARGAPAKHLGVQTDADRFIHAYSGRAVCESYLARWWTARIVHVFSFPGVDA